LGLVNKVLPAPELLPYTYDYARNLAATISPGSLRETKRQIYSDLHRDIGAAVRDSRSLIDRLMTETDFAEGVAAFTQKRPPRWTGS
jgi:enoyl-CoA hydratase/carnithine racemase